VVRVVGMTLGGTAAEPLVHIQDFGMDFGDTTVIKTMRAMWQPFLG
jgi:hypothetical protein